MAETGWGARDRARRPACILAINPLIATVREIDHAVHEASIIERAGRTLPLSEAFLEHLSVCLSTALAETSGRRSVTKLLAEKIVRPPLKKPLAPTRDSTK